MQKWLLNTLLAAQPARPGAEEVGGSRAHAAGGIHRDLAGRFASRQPPGRNTRQENPDDVRCEMLHRSDAHIEPVLP